jgi:hypothetical protein
MSTNKFSKEFFPCIFLLVTSLGQPAEFMGCELFYAG